MPVTKQAARVAEAKKIAEAKAKKATTAEQEQPNKEEAKKYNEEHLIQVVSAIIASDKTTLLNMPAAVNKAKQVLDEIYS